MDFHPWYLLPRTALLVTMSLAFWRLLLHRGVDPLRAVPAGALPVALATTSWMDIVPIGHAVVYLCALAIGWSIEQGQRADRTYRLRVSVLLTVALASTASGPALWAGVAAMGVTRKSLRSYLPVSYTHLTLPTTPYV